MPAATSHPTGGSGISSVTRIHYSGSKSIEPPTSKADAAAAAAAPRPSPEQRPPLLQRRSRAYASQSGAPNDTNSGTNDWGGHISQGRQLLAICYRKTRFQRFGAARYRRREGRRRTARSLLQTEAGGYPTIRVGCRPRLLWRRKVGRSQWRRRPWWRRGRRLSLRRWRVAISRRRRSAVGTLSTLLHCCSVHLINLPVLLLLEHLHTFPPLLGTLLLLLIASSCLIATTTPSSTSSRPLLP